MDSIQPRRLTTQEMKSLSRQLPASVRVSVVGFFRACPLRHAHGVREYANGFVEHYNMSHGVQLLFWQYVNLMLGREAKPIPVKGLSMIPLELL